jgi:hypothetical protein
METSACSFCGRTVDQVTHFVQGPSLFICDICVDACVDTLATKDHGWIERQTELSNTRSGELGSRHPAIPNACPLRAQKRISRRSIIMSAWANSGSDVCRRIYSPFRAVDERRSRTH